VGDLKTYYLYELKSLHVNQGKGAGISIVTLMLSCGQLDLGRAKLTSWASNTALMLCSQPIPPGKESYEWYPWEIFAGAIHVPDR
jgi:hypothetical protein